MAGGGGGGGGGVHRKSCIIWRKLCHSSSIIEQSSYRIVIEQRSHIKLSHCIFHCHVEGR